MKAGWIALAIAAPALLLGVFVLSKDEGSTADAVRAEPDIRGDAAHREAGAAAPLGQGRVASSPSSPAAASRPAAFGVADVAPIAPPPGVPVIASIDTRAAVSAPPDARVPPIDPPPADAPAPAQPWEVADPALYRAREQRLEREVDERFVQAAAARLPQLRAAVDEMRARGASPADIARAEDKIAHLQAVQDTLQRGEALAASAPIEAPANSP